MRQQLNIGLTVAAHHVWILHIRYVQDSAETGRAIENLIRVNDEVGMFPRPCYYRERRVRGTKIAAVKRRNVIVVPDELRLRSVFDIQNDHTRIPPCSVNAVVVIDDFVALNNLLLPIRSKPIERTVLLSFHLTLNMPRAYRFDCFGIAVINDQKGFPIDLARVLTTCIRITVVDIEPVLFAVGCKRNESKLLRFARI